MDYKEFQGIKNLRKIKPNEIVFDIDNRELGFEAINFIALKLYNRKYRFEIYYAEGQKSPHLHIKEIPYIDKLSKEQNKQYKEKILDKYSEGYIPDKSLCVYEHLIAEENKPHFKYKTIKRLLGIWNDNLKNFCEKDIYEQAKQEQEYKPKIKGSGITAHIIRNISIIDLARSYGLDVNKSGFAVCPFHEDNNPSLKFYEEQGRFFCFGCNLKGNIIDFLALLKLNGFQKIKNGE